MVYVDVVTWVTIPTYWHFVPNGVTSAPEDSSTNYFQYHRAHIERWRQNFALEPGRNPDWGQGRTNYKYASNKLTYNKISPYVDWKTNGQEAFFWFSPQVFLCKSLCLRTIIVTVSQSHRILFSWGGGAFITSQSEHNIYSDICWPDRHINLVNIMEYLSSPTGIECYK